MPSSPITPLSTSHQVSWVLPLVFPLMMVMGAVMGVTGVYLPGVEIGIATSVALLGLLIAFVVALPLWCSAIVVALFAMMHGYAHGTELPRGASAAFYGAGFILATASLHLIGVLIGLVAGDAVADKAVRLGGAGIAATGFYLLAI